jgi:Tol biopolymer transport system component
VFVFAPRSGNRDIYVMDSDGSNMVQLTHSDTEEEHPQWSPTSFSSEE